MEFILCSFDNKATVAGEIGDVISGKLAVPEGKTRIFKSLGKLLWAVEESEVKYSQINRVGAGANPYSLTI